MAYIIRGLICFLCPFQVVHEELSMVKMTSPYVPGFLAFREAGFLVEKVERVRREKPEIMPQAVLVDGNGILHPKSVWSHLLVCCTLQKYYERFFSYKSVVEYIVVNINLAVCITTILKVTSVTCLSLCLCKVHPQHLRDSITPAISTFLIIMIMLITM